MNRPARGRGDDGIVMVFTALLLVTLMVSAAFAIDLGETYAARRNDQNAADTSSLGGAQSLTDTDANLASQVKTLAHNTLGVTFTPTQWNSCGSIADPDSVDTAVSGSNCITVNQGRSQVQVRIPTTDLPSRFGRVVGINGYSHTAFAIAGLRRQGFGAVLPFGLGAGAGGNDGLVCVKTGPGGHSEPPCDGPSSGNFGYLDFAYFGNSDLNIPNPDCSNGNQRTRNENNAAVGVDHDLSKWNSAPHGIVDVVDTASPCGGTARPNGAYTLTGNTPQNFGAAIYSGSGYSDGLGGRLQRSGSGVFSGAGSQTNVGGHTLDDNPLWEFLPTTFPVGADVPTSCAKSIFTQVLANNYSSLPTAPADVRSFIQPITSKAEQTRLLLQRCISHYNGITWTANGAVLPVGDPPAGCSGACDDPLFTRNSDDETPDLYDIQYTARFGYVPELTAAFPNGTATVRFATFRPIFFQRLLGGNCSGGTCSHDFEPGVGYSKAAAEDKADGITAFVLPRNSLPNGLGQETAPFDVGVNRFVTLIR